MEKERIIKEVFELAMHSIRNEEIFLKQQSYEKHIENEKNQTKSAIAVIIYEKDIMRAAESIHQRREWLYELMDKFYKED